MQVRLICPSLTSTSSPAFAPHVCVEHLCGGLLCVGILRVGLLRFGIALFLTSAHHRVDGRMCLSSAPCICSAHLRRALLRRVAMRLAPTTCSPRGPSTILNTIYKGLSCSTPVRLLLGLSTVPCVTQGPAALHAGSPLNVRLRCGLTWWLHLFLCVASGVWLEIVSGCSMSSGCPCVSRAFAA